MDKLIHTHLNGRLDIQEAAGAAVEKTMASMDLKALVKNPLAELAQVAQQALKITEKSAQEAASEGMRFAAEVKKRVEDEKAIIVQPSGDPQLNKEEAK